MKSLIILLTAFFFSQSSISQTTWYVSNSGVNSNNGISSSTPFKDVNYALNQAVCGDSLYILSGIYHEKIQATSICPENNRIILQGDTIQKPLIIGDSVPTNKYAVSATGKGYYFRNMAMTSPYPEQCSQSNQVIVGLGDHFTFDDIIVFNSGYDGIKTYGNCSTNDYATNWKIINSEIYNCGLGCPPSIVNGDGVDFTQCHNCTIENSIIRNNMGHQLQIKLEAKNVKVLNSHFEGKHIFQVGLPGAVPQCDTNSFNADSIIFVGNTVIAKGDTSEFVFKLADVHNLFIHNNTIVKDSINTINIGFICFGGCSGGSFWTNTPSSPIDIKSNIFVNLSNTPFEYGADTSFFDPFNILATEVDMDYNLFFDNLSQISNPIDNGTNSMVANPLFCNYPLGFGLQSNSPCINAGDPLLPNDPDNSINDIGARYYQNSCITNVIENNKLTDIVLFPNPTTNYFTVESVIAMEGLVFNAFGQEVLQLKINHGLNTIDVSNLKPGSYYIRLKSNKDQVYSNLKFIKYN